jgi:transposase
VINTGRPVAVVARELGIGEQALGRWSTCSRAARGLRPVVETERAELTRLRRGRTPS